jgi:hypothetical protein
MHSNLAYSVFLEAVQRVWAPPEVKTVCGSVGFSPSHVARHLIVLFQDRLVLVSVGGFLVNMVGLFAFR